ncbi:MAG: putative Ig domain-containing protein, partial [Gammaproteobacteria bacterium]|nr:putative Ig domain-containing protein [Gammaproteobacteria bacterium]
EGRAAFLFFLHGFLLLSSYQVVKALREAFMLTKFSAETRSYAVALMALVLMIVVPFYGWVRRHLDGARLLRAVTIFFVVTMPLFALLAQAGVSIAFAFFIWVGIYGVMVVSQMWAFAADSFNVKSGQRLFVVIMLGANLGALAGSKVAQLAAAALSPIGLMVVAAAILGATLFLAGPERAAVPEGSRAISAEHGRPVPRLLGGIGLVMRDRYLLLIALLVVLLNWINSTGEFILADFVKADAAARVAASAGTLDMGTLITAFYGDFNFWVTLVSLGIQLFLVSRIYQAVGVRGALLIHPIIVAAAYGTLALAPVLGGFVPIFTLVRWIKVAENSVDYSLMNTTRQALFLPVDRDAKYDGKTAIDTFFWRFGDLIQALAVYVGLNHLHWDAPKFAVLNLVLAFAWIALAVAIGRGFSRKALENIMNVAPEAAEEIPDLVFAPGQPFLHPVSPTAFRDADPGDVLNLRACCDDGTPLPRWVRFDARQRTFTGTVPVDVEIDELRIAVIASDVDGLEARATFVVRRFVMT